MLNNKTRETNKGNEGRKRLSEAERVAINVILTIVLVLLSTPMFMNPEGNKQLGGQTVQTLQPVPEPADWAENHLQEPTGTPVPVQANLQEPLHPEAQQAPTPAVTPTP